MEEPSSCNVGTKGYADCNYGSYKAAICRCDLKHKSKLLKLKHNIKTKEILCSSPSQFRWLIAAVTLYNILVTGVVLYFVFNSVNLESRIANLEQKSLQTISGTSVKPKDLLTLRPLLSEELQKVSIRHSQKVSLQLLE